MKTKTRREKIESRFALVLAELSILTKCVESDWGDEAMLQLEKATEIIESARGSYRKGRTAEEKKQPRRVEMVGAIREEWRYGRKT